MQIYDRWGEMLFETNEYGVDDNSGAISIGWNGMIRGKGPAEAGTYVWVVKYTDIHKVPHQESGFFSLIR